MCVRVVVWVDASAAKIHHRRQMVEREGEAAPRCEVGYLLAARSKVKVDKSQVDKNLTDVLTEPSSAGEVEQSEVRRRLGCAIGGEGGRCG